MTIKWYGQNIEFLENNDSFSFYLNFYSIYVKNIKKNFKKILNLC